jgi:hypothetical protein
LKWRFRFSASDCLKKESKYMSGRNISQEMQRKLLKLASF